MSGYLIDTNVVSELRKGKRRNQAVERWFARRSAHELFLSIVTQAEIRRGILLVAKRDAAHARALAEWWTRVEDGYRKVGHLLSLRSSEAEAWAELSASRPLPVLDAFLAATAKTHDLVLVTRNTADFEGLPVEVENPFVD